jgi:hypothetical protein
MMTAMMSMTSTATASEAAAAIRDSLNNVYDGFNQEFSTNNGGVEYATLLDYIDSVGATSITLSINSNGHLVSTVDTSGAKTLEEVEAQATRFVNAVSSDLFGNHDGRYATGAVTSSYEGYAGTHLNGIIAEANDANERLLYASTQAERDAIAAEWQTYFDAAKVPFNSAVTELRNITTTLEQAADDQDYTAYDINLGFTSGSLEVRTGYSSYTDFVAGAARTLTVGSATATIKDDDEVVNDPDDSYIRIHRGDRIYIIGVFSSSYSVNSFNQQLGDHIQLGTHDTLQDAIDAIN